MIYADVKAIVKQKEVKELVTVSYRTVKIPHLNMKKR